MLWRAYALAWLPTSGDRGRAYAGVWAVRDSDWVSNEDEQFGALMSGFEPAR